MVGVYMSEFCSRSKGHLTLFFLFLIDFLSIDVTKNYLFSVEDASVHPFLWVSKKRQKSY